MALAGHGVKLQCLRGQNTLETQSLQLVKHLANSLQAQLQNVEHSIKMDGLKENIASMIAIFGEISLQKWIKHSRMLMSIVITD